MSAWFVCPSKRPPEEVKPILNLWIERGYDILIQRDESEALIRQPALDCAAVHYRPYHGYADAVNYLSAQVIRYSDAQWIVCAGDDTEPDANHSAEDLARQMTEYFQGTFGVCQFTGDRWGEDPSNNNPAWRSAYIDRVAGSPWMGREFCLRVNQGRGPLWPDYFHCFADEELQHVATRLGVFWQRPDLIHLHKHWGRVPGSNAMGNQDNMPDFLKRANSSEEWKKAKALFTQRLAAGFPGSEPL